MKKWKSKVPGQKIQKREKEGEGSRRKEKDTVTQGCRAFFLSSLDMVKKEQEEEEEEQAMQTELEKGKYDANITQNTHKARSSRKNWLIDWLINWLVD